MWINCFCTADVRLLHCTVVGIFIFPFTLFYNDSPQQLGAIEIFVILCEVVMIHFLTVLLMFDYKVIVAQ